MALYNEMRPKRLSDVRGQERVVKVLIDNLKSGHVPNSMLFVGTRGTGKTTVAKIVARSLNCTSPGENGECCCECPSCKSILDGSNMDVIELDAASNNSVEDVRKIIELVQFRPVGKKKVVICDEVHMFSTGAWNAFLKIMEEPPQDVHFILCTTELHKVPATILSRCRKFKFENISLETIVSKLEMICQKKGLNADKEALKLVAKAANGSMRDAESIFESFIDEENITASLVREHLGFTQEELVFLMLESIVSGEPSGAFDAIKEVVKCGGSLTLLLEDVMHLVLDVIYLQSCGEIAESKNSQRICSIAQSASQARFLEIAEEIRKAYERKTTNMELLLQGMVVSLVSRSSTISLLEKKVKCLEEQVTYLTQNGISIIASQNVSPAIPAQPDNTMDAMVFEPITEEEFSPPVEDIPASNEEDNTDGFIPLSDADMAELAALGFSVDLPVESSEATLSVEEEVEDDEAEAGSGEESVFFGDFARQFGSGGGFGSFGGF